MAGESAQCRIVFPKPDILHNLWGGPPGRPSPRVSLESKGRAGPGGPARTGGSAPLDVCSGQHLNKCDTFLGTPPRRRGAESKTGYVSASSARSALGLARRKPRAQSSEFGLSRRLRVSAVNRLVGVRSKTSLDFCSNHEVQKLCGIGRKRLPHQGVYV